MATRPARRPGPARRGFSWGRAGLYVLLLLGAFVAVMPFLFMASTSLKTIAETITRVSPIPFDPDFWPTSPQWVNYSLAWTRASFGLYFRNSVLTAAFTVAGVLFTSSLAAYAFAKIRFFGSRILFAVLLATLIIPESVYLVPNFITITRLGWYDRLAGLTVPFMASAFYIFLLRQFFAQLPSELLESSRIDGAGHVRAFLSIMLPLSHAPLFTVAFLAFIGSWNSLQWPLVATSSPRWRPITVGLTTFITDAGPENQMRMAGAMIAVLPVVLLYFVAQKQFTEAIARSGIKG
ncbi:MAG: carbohydrate ABC transporter permease [Spirochaetes bacterium]|nr:carbohydrate ABC transporter permease [Spirochaetota bacterium]